MKKFFKTLGYAIGFYGTMYILDKIKNRKKKTYFTV